MNYSSDACFEVRAALPLFVGGDLEREELSAVEEHLTGCSSCEALHVRSLAARAVLTDAGEPSPVPNLWSGVRGQLRDEGLLVPVGPRSMNETVGSTPSRQLRLVPLGVMSAAAAVMFAFLLAGMFPADEGGPSGQPGYGSGVTDTAPVGHVKDAPTEDPKVAPVEAGGLRPLAEGEEPMVLRAREMRTEQGLVVPESVSRSQPLTPAGLRRGDDR